MASDSKGGEILRCARCRNTTTQFGYSAHPLGSRVGRPPVYERAYGTIAVTFWVVVT